jgi:hypothetical protein
MRRITNFRLNRRTFYGTCAKVLEPADIVISDMGAHKMWTARQFRAEQPNTCIIANKFAAMGIAVAGRWRRTVHLRSILSIDAHLSGRELNLDSLAIVNLVLARVAPTQARRTCANYLQCPLSVTESHR